ncbi:MAG: FAD-dependent oxidoreductase [Proteobacteria bacterium]|nr:MAG: FAD-dependent oxidoreductase [Pseudomonadota bacterium]PIE68173.1 MAG: FAD-dependent oxidoreductase [Deltaproteobacteria bacterium]
MEKKYDAIIIGAGIIGCCTAFELSKLGYKTLNIDKESTAGIGSTGNSCGNIRFYYSTRDGVALAYESAWYWHNWREYLGVDDERGIAPFHNTGSIFIKSRVIDWPKIKKNFEEVGVKFEEWDVDKLKKKVPIGDFHSFYPPKRYDDPHFNDEPTEHLDGACFTPESGYVGDPTLATQNVEAAAKNVGATFLYNQTVTGIRQENNKVKGVTLADGTEIDADIVVNVSGPHSFKVTEMAGQTDNNLIKTKALRHEVHVVPPPEGFKPLEDGYHTNDADIGAYYRPEAGNMILTGSVDPECDPKEFVDPDNYNQEVTEEQWKAQVYRLARRIPDMPIPNKTAGIVDLYDVSDDWLPIYDKSDLDGYYQAIGTSGNQFKTAPVVGAMMAALIKKVEEGYDHDAKPMAYKLPHLGVTIATSVFHRKRKINPDSSFSVIG